MECLNSIECLDYQGRFALPNSQKTCNVEKIIPSLESSRSKGAAEDDDQGNKINSYSVRFRDNFYVESIILGVLFASANDKMVGDCAYQN